MENKLTYTLLGTLVATLLTGALGIGSLFVYINGGDSF